MKDLSRSSRVVAVTTADVVEGVEVGFEVMEASLCDGTGTFWVPQLLKTGIWYKADLEVLLRPVGKELRQ